MFIATFIFFICTTALHFYCHYYYYYCYYYIIIRIITIIANFIIGSNSSKSTSSSIIIIIIISSRSINKISVLLTISTAIFGLFMLPLVLPQYTPPLFFLRDQNGNKATQLLSVILVIAPYRDVFYHNFQF